MAETNTTSSQWSAILDKLVWAFVIPLIVGIIQVILEYAVVQPASKSMARTSLTINAVLIVSLILCSISTLSIWIKRKRHVRERFALFATMTVALIMMVTIVSTYSGMFPWLLAQPLSQWYSGTEILSPVAETIHYVFLWTIVFVGISWLRTKYIDWTDHGGRESFQEHERKEHSQRPNMLVDAYAELARILNRLEPFSFYVDVDSASENALPSGVIESLAWKDQARDLVSLSSPSYTFSERTDWHDARGCWIGTNIHSNGLVLINPIQYMPHESEVDEVINYGGSIAAARNTILDEVFLALKALQGSPNLAREYSPIRVHIYTEQSLLERIVNFADYRDYINRRIMEVKLPESHLTIEDVYVRPYGQVLGSTNQDCDIENYLRAWLEEHSRQHVALLGTYGQGKSTTALMLTYKLLNEHPTLPPRVPLLIELRGRNVLNLEPEAILGQWAARYGLNGKALMRLHEAGRLLLIFEGFDEMAQLSNLEMRRSYFKALWEFARY
ncbi:MAG: hypothetical protein JOZ51_10540, partial [Chloroflexi bacterium]|nr:hypothetical protein [Chloroflexota bacterium]